MKCTAKCVAAVMCACIGAFASVIETAAQLGGTLYVAADPAASSREFTDAPPGLCTIYIVHDGPVSGFTGSRFKVRNNDFFAPFLSDESDFAFLGSSQTGIAISYGSCIAPPVLILSVHYFCQDNSGCTEVSLDPHPEYPSFIEVFGCSGEVLPLGGVAPLCVNGVLVEDDFLGYCACSVPVDETTWGGVKALYE